MNRLKDAYVVYWDILGFSDLSKRGDLGEMEESLNSIIQSFDKAYHKIKESESKFLKKKIFTDNIVLVAELSTDLEGESEFAILMWAVLDIQLSLALDGMFIRGGITFGKIYIDDDIVFGPALLEAYEKETKTTYPRVALTDKAVEQVRKYHKYYGGAESNPAQNQIFLDTRDSNYFLNYLSAALDFDMMEDAISEGYIPTADDYPTISKHKEIVEDKLKRNSNNTRVFEKYSWIAEYHNEYCRLENLPIKLQISVPKREIEQFK